jgi:transcription initiation factor IIE alpha subunit
MYTKNKYNNKAVVNYSDSRGHHKNKALAEETIEALKELTPNAFRLFMYYNSRWNGWEFSDKEISDTLGVTEKTLRRLIKELKDKKYLLIEKSKKRHNYYVGKQAVQYWKKEELSIEKD